MKKLLMLTLLFLLPVCAHAEYWDHTVVRPVVCCDDRPGCQVLQAVMMGSFTDFDPADSLNVRVLSAALPRLTTVAEDDFAHFSDSYNVDETIIRQFYYIALGNCLWADITISPLAEDADEQNARTVLHLFLAPAEEKDSVEQREIIRANTTQQTLEVISEKAKVPVGFVEYLMLNGNEEAAPSTGRLQNENS